MTSLLYRKGVMKTSDRLFSLDELSSLTALKKRTIRYYIQKGLVDAPEGTGKGAVYTLQHLEQLLTLIRLKSSGLYLDRIRELIKDPEQPSHSESYLYPVPRKNIGHVEVWSRIHLNHGVELNIEPIQAGLNPEQINFLCQEIMKMLETSKKRENA